MSKTQIRRYITIFCLAATFFAGQKAFAQEPMPPMTPNDIWVFADPPKLSEGPYYQFSNSEKVHVIISRILKSIGLESAPFEIYATGRFHTAAARRAEDGTRVIYYNEEWLQRVVEQKEWQALTVLAHEIGHHFNNHTLSDLTMTRYQQELQADKFAGHIMFKLGYPLEKALSAYRELPDAILNSTHPLKKTRRQAVTVWWREASEQLKLSTSNINEVAELKAPLSSPNPSKPVIEQQPVRRSQPDKKIKNLVSVSDITGYVSLGRIGELVDDFNFGVVQNNKLLPLCTVMVIG